MRPVLVVVAAAIVVERRLLLVSKQVAPDVFYLPGGKPEPGESDDACLSREIAALAWFSPHQSFAGVLAPAVADSVVPALAADALI